MSEPSREHVEAVAGHLHDVTCAFCDADGFACGAPREGDGYDFTAHVILTSTDPAVLDAMQDALVRAGRLREERTEWGIKRPSPFLGIIHDDMWSRDAAERSRDVIAGGGGGEWSRSNWHIVSRRVLVTEWEPIKGGDDA